MIDKMLLDSHVVCLLGLAYLCALLKHPRFLPQMLLLSPLRLTYEKFGARRHGVLLSLRLLILIQLKLEILLKQLLVMLFLLSDLLNDGVIRLLN